MNIKTYYRTIGVSCSVLALTFAACLSLSPQLHAQSVHRLFSTPSTRAELDRLRNRVLSGIVVEEPIEDDPIFEIPIDLNDEEDVVYALGGTMRKADGSYAVWINDIAYDQNNLPRNMELLSPFSRGQLRIRNTQSGASYNVKPGQVLNLTTGQIFESYQYRAEVEAARPAAEDEVDEELGTGSVILDSAAVESVVEAASDL